MDAYMMLNVRAAPPPPIDLIKLHPNIAEASWFPRVNSMEKLFRFRLVFNPRTAGGLSHLRTAGGGGHICAPPPG